MNNEELLERIERLEQLTMSTFKIAKASYEQTENTHNRTVILFDAGDKVWKRLTHLACHVTVITLILAVTSIAVFL